MAPTKQQSQKGVKKGGKKKTTDPFSKKEWYELRAPSMFSNRTCARTLITRTQGTKIASEGLKGRVIQLSLGDLSDKTQDIFRKFKLQVEDVQGRHCLTNFHGMDLTRDKLCGMVLKWQSTIEAHVDVKTTDGYTLRFFVIAFTKKQEDQKSHAYAQTTRIKKLRAKIVEVVQREVARCDLKSVVQKLIPDSIGQDAMNEASSIFPLSGALVRKVKVLKKPKLDLGRILELHSEIKTDEYGEGVARPDHYEPPVVNAV
ncbi:40S ribosomal protein S3a [Echinococcus granulosus]|uniref:Small ribosomal subunit protein eS1 n=1 Tax=Echinococcus granulosus TaxID=6210 RepID=W6UR93_ECHGR|nr:40S ribosomal protein S3a [Echinococcus granulosus]EUB64260.1 40S ribosomal protein S3a [Echinococcus granulosus]KAH9283834.1 40S ribosomal protein S3a [Echinococcus granulosus]